MSYAAAVDVAAGFRPLTAAEALIVPTLLGRAEAILIASVPSLLTRVGDGSLSVDLVVLTEAAMVERVLRNPNGRRQESTSLGALSESWTIDNAVSSGALYASEVEVARLSPTARRPLPGSVRIGTWQ